MSRIGIFLDRDGTINQEVDYLRSPDDLHLLEGAAAGIRELNQCGCRVFVITNQSGIARGLLTEQQLDAIHQKLRTELKAENAYLDAIYYCPHHPEGNPPYRMECDCRKPNTGMIDRAIKEFQIDTGQSFVVGDRLLDIQTGKNVGAQTILVLTGYGKQELQYCRDHNVQIDFVAENLYDAVTHIKKLIHCEPHNTLSK